MKLIVLVALVAVAAAQNYVQGSDKDAEIVQQSFNLNEDGSFDANSETSNGIVQQSAGQSSPGAEPETGSYFMQGSYSYTAPDGTPIQVTWTAGEEGYQAQSDSIPQATNAQQPIDDVVE